MDFLPRKCFLFFMIPGLKIYTIQLPSQNAGKQNNGGINDGYYYDFPKIYKSDKSEARRKKIRAGANPV
jgi:hypothetical protein